MPKGERFRVEVTPEDEVTLRMWAGARKGKRRLCERAQVVLLSAEGKPVGAMSAASGLSPRPPPSGAGATWRRASRDSWIGPGPAVRPRLGHRPVCRGGTRELKAPGASTRWSTRRLAQQTGLGPTSVHRILKEGRLKPHRTTYWCGRTPRPRCVRGQASGSARALSRPSHQRPGAVRR
jgi:hypothetical protein